ncbi:MAG: hypothetical protein JJ905_05850 [Psychroserpens sp.]|nr:hypothetical protein [Psychroserpens sp.]MBO6630908.1 hypothetical protein [Psychroserpens sp.]MBO6655098.1 hypothetical protein [Psychroserpens sp.]MBO6683097.1 hypothetical protein [Psychroserpens sp.]MBO6749724.1 hypothetical protein [Psychroserpens sp.]
MTLTIQAQDTKSDEDKMAQYMELMSKKIEMEVDTALFIEATPNTYVSESPKAVIMAMYVPESYENSKKKMNENADPAFQVSDKGETEINGVKVLFMKGTSSAEGVTMESEIYCMEIEDELCMMFLGLTEQGIDAKYVDAVTKAMHSVIKKK